MDTITVEANIKTVVDTKHNIENMIKRESTTKTIIKNTIRATSVIGMTKKEIITIKRQELEIRVRQEQEIQVRQEQEIQEHVIVIIGKREVVSRRIIDLS